MPFPMRVRPFEPGSAPAALGGDNLPVVALKPLPQKSRLKRLLERQFRVTPAAVAAAAAAAASRIPERAPSPGTTTTAGGDVKDKDSNQVAASNTTAEPEPSSLCLSKMVHNFLEGNNDKPARCGRRRCSCFNGSCDDSSDDELDSGGEYSAPAPMQVSEIVKSLVSCISASERNLLGEVSKIMERSRVRFDKDEASRRRIVADGLIALGYDASVCKSRWEKSASVPDGEYEYIDVVLDGTGTEDERRVLVDIDFRSEFEIARSTKRYRAVLQSLPAVFVGRADRLQQVVAVAAEAARQSLKKRGLHVPPWRKSEYMKAKWLSPYQRTTARTDDPTAPTVLTPDRKATERDGDGGVGNVVGDPNPSITDGDKLLTKPAGLAAGGFAPDVAGAETEKNPAGGGLAVRVATEASASSEWQPPAVTPKAPTPKGVKVVTGLASIILSEEKDDVDG